MSKTLGIKGLGPKTIEKLQLGDITELFYMDRDSVVEAVGEKVADKLFSEIEKAKSADLETVLASFSIPLVGMTASAKIAAVVSDIDEINAETCKLAGLGEKVTANLLNWLNTEFLEIREFLPFSFKSGIKTVSNTDGLTICITGKLSSYKTKAEAYAELTKLGFVVVESVTKNLKYLVDEQNNGSSKRKKAEEYGVTIVNNLLTFIESNT